MKKLDEGSKYKGRQNVLDAREVKSRCDFLTIASRYTRLRRAGRQYVGLCPFHSERHPSFYVEPDRKIYYCFGCRDGGDVFDFVMKADACSFLEAMQIINRSLGVATEAAEGGRRSKGAKPPLPAKPAVLHSPDYRTERELILHRLRDANKRLEMIRAENLAKAMELATPCEPFEWPVKVMRANQG